MADDVKVKFGGDFSAVGKGAKEAAAQAGTALSGQLSKFGEEMMSRVGAALALTALFDKFIEKLSEANNYFKELNDAIDKFGGGGEEFQRVAGLAKSVSIPMEVVAKSMGIFSKYIGMASKDAKGHGKVLRELGFDNEQISAGTISATDALAALSEQLKATGNDNLVAANATVLFGRAGAELMPIIQKGSRQIKEQAKDLQVYSDAELQAAEAAERAAARRQAAWSKFFRWLSLQMDVAETRGIVVETTADTFRDLAKSGVDMTTDEGKEKLKSQLIENLLKKGVGLDAQEVAFKEISKSWGSYPTLGALGSVFNTRESIDKAFTDILAGIEKAKADEKAAPKEVTSAMGGSTALSASSLQAIGGGDINSIYAGVSIQQAQLDAQVTTANNTTVLANQATNPVRSSGPTTVAK